MSNETLHHFDSTTQFILDGAVITLCQGSHYISSGYFSEWLRLFQAFEQAEGNHGKIKISQTLEGVWVSDGKIIVIQDPSIMDHHFTIEQKDLPTLEQSLLELHQGCCEPIPFNFVADISQKPDEILGMLQDITNFELSPVQLLMAKKSIAAIPTELEINILDLYQLWRKTPALSFFAKALRFYFLS